jgi:hypothetical protein
MYMIYFWILENHYLDRIMCQFKLYQQFPLPAPLSHQLVLQYRKTKQTSKGSEGLNMDWGKYYKYLIGESELHIIESTPYDYAEYSMYMICIIERDVYDLV